MSNPDNRRDTDFMKLMTKDYKVVLSNNEMHNFIVHFNGPVGTLYQGGASIGFVNKIYHPNIDERTGGVCLDVINSAWNPMFEYVLRYAKRPSLKILNKRKRAIRARLNLGSRYK